MARKRSSRGRTSPTGSIASSTTITKPPAPVRQVSVDLDSAERPFDNIINFRDVGASINAICGAHILNEKVLFRSARLDDASERDRKRLVDELHVSTVIDLRSNTEHDLAARKRRSDNLPDPTDVPILVDPQEDLLDLPGVRRVRISLTGRSFERALLRRLDWYHYLKVLGLLASGYRTEAVSLIARLVMQPRGLIGLARDTLDFSGAEMKAVFDVLANDDNDDRERRSSPSATIVHCTQGKDRTGLVVLLALLLTRVVPLDAIAMDYVRSEPELRVEFDERMKEIRAIGLDEEYTKCPPGFTNAIKSHLDARYGGVEGYLASIGVGREMQRKVRRKLVAAASPLSPSSAFSSPLPSPSSPFGSPFPTP